MRQEATVALVHDWLTGMRGGEKVLEVLARMFPAAPIYTMVHQPGSVSEALERHPIRTSGLQRLPAAAKRYRQYLPLMPYFVERMRLEPADIVLSVSTCVAKGILPPPGSRHFAYVNTPMRYLYDRYDDYFAPGRAGWATRCAMAALRRPLQRWDRRTMDRVDEVVGNSRFVAERIRRVYGREAGVLHPPVDTARFAAAAAAAGPPQDYYLMVTALVPYKNVDVAIEAFRGAPRRLVVAGSGPWLEKLRPLCPPNVELLGWVDDAALPEWIARCRAFLLPNVEDFGIAPVEAMAAGRPVVALAEGGVLDTVRDWDRWQAGAFSGSSGPTGLLYGENSPSGLSAALDRFESLEGQFRPRDAAAWAQQFGIARFEREIRAWLFGAAEQAARLAA